MSKITRRAFLGATAATLAAPAIVPASVFGRGRENPSERITMACIGTGGMGTGNLRNFLQRKEVQILAVCDVERAHRDRAHRIVTDYYGAQGRGDGGCVAVSDFREIMARSDIDTVMVATPDHWHAPMAIAAARSGKDIYCEKPISLTIGEGRATVAAMQRYGRIFQTGSWQRSQRKFRFACELVRNGRIGRVHTIEVGLPSGKKIGPQPTMPVPDGLDYDLWLGPAPHEPYTEARVHYNFRYNFDYSGGKICDWGAHHHDIAQWALGCDRSGPVKVEGVGEFPADGIYDTAYHFDTVHTYADGTVLKTSDRLPQGVRFEGDEGWIFISRSKFDANPKSLLSSTIGPDETHLYESQDHYQNFLDGVRTRRETTTPAEIAHRSISIAHLGNVAMRTGRVLDWNPEAEHFVGDTTANRYLEVTSRGSWHV